MNPLCIGPAGQVDLVLFEKDAEQRVIDLNVQCLEVTEKLLIVRQQIRDLEMLLDERTAKMLCLTGYLEICLPEFPMEPERLRIWLQKSLHVDHGEEP